TQLQLELMDARTDIIGLQDITRIWASFHFLPGDLYAQPKQKCSKKYLNKYRLICNPNSELLEKTVRLAKGKSEQAAGIAMHVLADTWAHRYFAGTPSLVINNINYHCFELVQSENGEVERKVNFRHNPSAPDDPGHSAYTNTVYYNNENSIMSLGHGRAGHLPDYCFVKYKYLPAWKQYEEIVKDNPADYLNAFCQMIYALKFLRGVNPSFERGKYDTEAAEPIMDDIRRILHTVQLDSTDDWRELGRKLSGHSLEEIDVDKIEKEYLDADDDKKDDTFLGKFIIGALAQKSMVTNQIFQSGNKLAGYSIEYSSKGFKGIRDFRKLLNRKERAKNE
ncbi:MAG: hypothetical protein II246_02275, partial [Ruminococcus sp.]|nr:hypothetical protein [Ruminococcus sp.]